MELGQGQRSNCSNFKCLDLLSIRCSTIAAGLSCFWSEPPLPPISDTLLLITFKTTFNYAPVMIGFITLVSLVGWVLPFNLGAKYWFKGPQKTIGEDVLEVTTSDMS
jgi:hypothetical protein